MTDQARRIIVRPENEPTGNLAMRTTPQADMIAARMMELMSRAAYNPHPNNAIAQQAYGQTQGAMQIFQHSLMTRTGYNRSTSSYMRDYIRLLSSIANQAERAERIATRRLNSAIRRQEAINSVMADRITTKTHIKNLKIVRQTEVVESEYTCTICLETLDISNVINTNCNHSYCLDCVSGYANSIKDKSHKPNCPMCRGVLDQLNTHSDELHQQLNTVIQGL